MAQMAGDVRGVLIPVTGATVLLPNATVSEVITYGEPQKIEQAPKWVYGSTQWRGWRIPLFSFSLLTGQAEIESVSGAKIAILKALSGDARLPFMAMLAQGFPRLTAVTKDNLILNGEQSDVAIGIKHRVMVNDNEAFVPDLEVIEAQLLKIIGD